MVLLAEKWEWLIIVVITMTVAVFSNSSKNNSRECAASEVLLCHVHFSQLGMHVYTQARADNIA